MRGQRPILEAALAAARRREPAVLATVVRVAGSAYRRPGARMLFPAESAPVGFISGGCLEADLAERAAQVAAAGRAATVVYDMRSPDDIVWGLGLGCNGEVRVLLELVDPAAPPPWIERVLRGLSARNRQVLVSVFEGAGLSAGAKLLFDGAGELSDLPPGETREQVAGAAREAHRSGRRGLLELSDGAALVEILEPPVRLLICGAGSDAVPLVNQARALDWEAEVVDRREGYARAERFPSATAVRVIDFERATDEMQIDDRTPVVIMTHHFLDDLALLAALLPGEAPYIGLIGPAARREHLLEELQRRGVQPDTGRWERLFGPVGLDIGSETAEEIALSVVAEIRAVLSGHRGGFLRERGGPLHDPP